MHDFMTDPQPSLWARLFPLPGAWKTRAFDLLRASGLGRLELAVPAGNLAAIAYK